MDPRYDNNDLEEEGRYNYRPPPPPQTQHPAGVVKNPTSVDTIGGGQPPQDPWWTDYNNGSPPAIPLGGGMQGWNWDGGRWWQTPNAPQTGPPPTPAPPPPPPAPPKGNGEVPSLQGNGINIPSSTLPGDVQATFNKPAQQTPVQSAYQTALLKYMDQSQQTPSLDDPILGPQAEVYRVQQQRNQERNRRSAAERAAATGLSSSGALDRKIEQGVQAQRFNTAQYNANLLGRELERRRNELLSALQLASATGNQEATRELQARLAQVSAQMQQQGLNLQGQLGRGDLDLRMLQTLLGNDQFYDQLGINTALNLEGLNQNALQFAFR